MTAQAITFPQRVSGTEIAIIGQAGGLVLLSAPDTEKSTSNGSRTPTRRQHLAAGAIPCGA